MLTDRLATERTVSIWPPYVGILCSSYLTNRVTYCVLDCMYPEANWSASSLKLFVSYGLIQNYAKDAVNGLLPSPFRGSVYYEIVIVYM